MGWDGMGQEVEDLDRVGWGRRSRIYRRSLAHSPNKNARRATQPARDLAFLFSLFAFNGRSTPVRYAVYLSATSLPHTNRNFRCHHSSV